MFHSRRHKTPVGSLRSIHLFVAGNVSQLCHLGILFEDALRLTALDVHNVSSFSRM